MDIEGVRTRIRSERHSEKRMRSWSDSRPDNLNYIVAAEMNNEMYNRLENKIRDLTAKKLGIDPKEPTPVRLWDKQREIKENDPEIRALIDRKNALDEKNRSYPLFGLEG